MHLKTIENWRRGVNLPSPKKVHLLADLVANGDSKLKKEWARSLIDARTSEIQEKKNGKVSNETKSISSSNLNSTDSFELSQQTTDNSHAKDKHGFIHDHFALLVFSATLFLAASYIFYKAKNPPELNVFVSNMLFCDDSTFSKELKKCTLSITTFPSDTKKIYVSFDLEGLEYGQSFQRSWYRNGSRFLNRNVYIDELWEGWTFLGNEYIDKPVLTSIQDGTYAMRIIADEKLISTNQFTIGDVSPNEG